MVVVYLKNGEKAPLPDANYVKIETVDPSGALLRCFFGQTEVGQFKWDEVAGYTIAVLPTPDISPHAAYEAWNRLEA
jgi:hypothetical protein